MKKIFSIIMIFCLTLGLTTVCIAADSKNNEIEPYDIITKTATYTHVESCYVSELETTVKIRFRLTGTYTCDRASGEIKSAYKCTLNSVELAETPANAANGIDSFEVSSESFTSSGKVNTKGYAEFTANIVPRLKHNRSGVLAHNILLDDVSIKFTVAP